VRISTHAPGVDVAPSPPLARRRIVCVGSSGSGTKIVAIALIALVAGVVAWGANNGPAATSSSGGGLVPLTIVSVAWSPSTFVINNTTTGVVAASGGQAPYTYAWAGLPPPCISTGSASVTCTPDEVGTFNVTVTVSDRTGVSTADSAALTVDPSPGGPGDQRPAGLDVKLVSGGLLDTAGQNLFGVVAQTNCYNCIEGRDGTYLNETPYRDIRYGQGGESCDVVNDTFYQAGLVSGACPYSISALKQWCYSTTPHCEWYVGLPGEINDPAYIGYEAKWLVDTLHFPPTYWSIGNEPESYTNWNCPWKTWATCTGTPTAKQWAAEVLAYAKAIRAVVPTAKIIGIQAVGSYSTFIPALAASPAAKYLYAIAFHDYPPPSGSSTTDFLSLLTSQYALTAEVNEVREKITAANASMANVPIFVGEFNGGPCPVPSVFDQEFPDVLLYMGTVVQALEANLSELDYFALANDGFSLVGTTYVPYPTGTWMEEMKGVRYDDAYNYTISGHVPNVWSVVWKDGASDTLMVVNANPSDQLSLAVDTSFAVGSSGHSIVWNTTDSKPVVASLTLTQYYAIPPESILLLENY
jgi:Cellulase (glycosyl hydrolase family 5)